MPGLLFPDSRIGILQYLSQRSELLGIERVDGRETFKLRIEQDSGWSWSLWIDTQSYLIVRILSRHAATWAPGTTVEELLVYHPQLNVPVAAAALTFQPGPARPVLWRIFSAWQSSMLFFAVGLILLMELLNRVHRRLLGGARRRKREVWLATLQRRLTLGYFGIFAASLGLWLGGAEFELATTNYLIATFMVQAGFGFYAMHRRTSGYARLAAT